MSVHLFCKTDRKIQKLHYNYLKFEHVWCAAHTQTVCNDLNIGNIAINKLILLTMWSLMYIYIKRACILIIRKLVFDYILCIIAPHFGSPRTHATVFRLDNGVKVGWVLTSKKENMSWALYLIQPNNFFYIFRWRTL